MYLLDEEDLIWFELHCVINPKILATLIRLSRSNSVAISCSHLVVAKLLMKYYTKITWYHQPIDQWYSKFWKELCVNSKWNNYSSKKKYLENSYEVIDFLDIILEQDFYN